VLQAPQFQRPSFDFLTFEKDGLAAACIDICRGKTIQALVIALMVVVPDKHIDLGFEISRQEVVFQQDAVLECLMPALDLALSLRMIGRAEEGETWNLRIERTS